MDAFESSLNDLLVVTFNNILKYEEVSLKNLLNVPVTINEAHMLEAIWKQEGGEATVGKIAALQNVAIPTATVAVQKLENKGFIKKVPCKEDGRRAIVSLTATGRKIEMAHRLFHERMVGNIGGQFTDEEKGILLNAVKTLSEFFRKKTEGAN